MNTQPKIGKMQKSHKIILFRAASDVCRVTTKTTKKHKQEIFAVNMEGNVKKNSKYTLQMVKKRK